MMKMLKILIVPMLVLAGLFSSGCATDRQVISQAAGMHNQLEPAVIEDPDLAGYLQRVGERIIATAQELDRQGYGPKSHRKEKSDWMFGQDMKFHFVNSETLNAFTTGGNHMYIYTQLFEECKTEDELAAVMAHEYAHIYARHVSKGMDRQYTALAAAAALGGAGYLAGGDEKGAEYATYGAVGGLALGQFVNMGFTRGDENEADELGFTFYTRAGWDPDRFDDFFQNMIDKGLDTTPEMVSDHPSLKNRVAETKERVKKLPAEASQWRQAPVASPKEFQRLQARAEELGKTLPSDKTLANSQQLLQALPRSCVMPIDPPDAQQAREEIVKEAQEAQKTEGKAPPPDQKVIGRTPSQ
jgi:predicted Zn-dependent protease